MKSLIIGAACGAVIALSMVMMAKSIAIACWKYNSFNVSGEVFECMPKEQSDGNRNR